MTLALFESADVHATLTMEDLALQLRERLPWLWAPGFNIACIEGYRPGVFGARAGTLDANAYNVLHEVAHAIEIVNSDPQRWKRRLGQSDYGMRIKSYQTIAGERYYEPVTMQATERECRVGAIQLHLLQAGGYATESFVQRYVVVLKYMADSCFGGSSILNARDPAKYTPAQQEWVRTRTQLLEAAYAQYTPQSIQDIWSEVTKVLAKKNVDLPHAQVYGSAASPSPN